MKQTAQETVRWQKNQYFTDQQTENSIAYQFWEIR